MERKHCNILITGTPGTGKTRLSKLIAEKTGLKYVDIGQIVKENPQLHDGTDPEFDALMIDDDKLNEFLELILLHPPTFPSTSLSKNQPPQQESNDKTKQSISSSSSNNNNNSSTCDSNSISGGYIVDFHSPEVFDEDWFDLILVLKCSTNILYDRLMARGYHKKKIDENMECEIMQIVLEACQECFEKELIHELDSNDEKDMISNTERICLWYENWKSNQQENDMVNKTKMSEKKKEKEDDEESDGGKETDDDDEEEAKREDSNATKKLKKNVMTTNDNHANSTSVHQKPSKKQKK